MDEVIIPSSNDFNIEAEKTDELQLIEAEQHRTQKSLAAEAKHDKFPLIREHFEQIISEYNDITGLANLPADEVAVVAKTKAAIVAELKLLLHHIDEAVGAVDSHERREE